MERVPFFGLFGFFLVYLFGFFNMMQGSSYLLLVGRWVFVLFYFVFFKIFFPQLW